jgi:RIO kinase 1
VEVRRVAFVQKGKLIVLHYTLRYHREHLYIIDVSQSVEHDHPYAFDFLRADITHVDEYFTKRGGIKTLGLRNTFEWIIKPPAKTAEDGKQGVLDDVVAQEDAITDPDQETQRSLNSLQTLASGPFQKIERHGRELGESDEDLTKVVRILMKKR